MFYSLFLPGILSRWTYTYYIAESCYLGGEHYVLAELLLYKSEVLRVLLMFANKSARKSKNFGEVLEDEDE